MKTSLLQQAVSDIGGFTAVGRLCDVSAQAVRKWCVNGLPRTEWTGETDYASRIAEAHPGNLTREQLLNREPAGSKLLEEAA